MCSNGASMAKKRSWFNLVRRFFIPDTHSNQEKEKRRKWVFFGRMKVKSRLPSISAPSPPRERTATTLITEAEEQQSKRALNVALATAAAAEAAVAAAHAAAEVVLLTGVPHQCPRDDAKEEHSAVKPQADTLQFEKEIHQTAAIKIQTAFRGYLARKALHALKGIVKLQAIIRGRNVRRQAMNTLKCLQSIVSIQSQVCAKRIQMVEETCAHYDESKHFEHFSDKIIKMDTNSERRWDGSILTKEEAEALFVSKKEAAIKRERIREYAFNHRNSAETERSKANGRWRYWLDQWVDTQMSKSKELEDLDTVLTSTPKPRVEYRGKQVKLRGLQNRQYNMEGGGTDSPVAATPRRSFHRKQNSLGEDNVIPTYMAATESAKAKTRSLSSPKLRPGSYDAYSDSYSPCKNKLSLISSTATEVPSSGKFGKASAYQQRSPSLKNLPGPVKSNRTLKDLSIDSEFSLRTWDRQSAFR